MEVKINKVVRSVEYSWPDKEKIFYLTIDNDSSWVYAINYSKGITSLYLINEYIKFSFPIVIELDESSPCSSIERLEKLCVLT